MQLSCLVFIYLLFASCGNFVMHFIYSQRQILIYRRDTASVRCISRPAKSLYESTLAATLSSAAEGERERERRGGEKREKERLARHSETLKHNATIPLMKFL